MKLLSISRAVGIGLLCLSPLAQAEIALDDILGFKVSFEGLVQADRTQYSDDVATLINDSELRRAELILKGKKGDLDWVVGYDASTRNDKWLDVNARYKVSSKLGVQAGQYKQPNSLEELSSTRHNDFIVKSMATQTFAVARRVGANASWQDTSWTLTGGWFGREITDGGGTGAGYGARATWAPFNDDGSILHFGLSAVSHDTNLDQMRYRARPGMDMSTTPRLIDSGTLRNTDRVRSVGIESFWVNGPFKLQGEYFDGRASRIGMTPDYNADGWYVSGMWNLTGETWGYRGGVINTNKPAHPSGMWQVGLRYEGMNLNDGVVRGGEEKNLTVGINWYARKNFKFSLNYVRADVTRGNGLKDKPTALEGRLQLHW